MRALTLLLALTLVAATGYCTGQYVETGEDHVDGLIQKGDVFEYHCELPQPLEGQQQLTLRVIYPNGELLQALFAPRVLIDEVALHP